MPICEYCDQVCDVLWLDGDYPEDGPGCYSCMESPIPYVEMECDGEGHRA
jgi:hypothetical protein